MDVLSLVGNSKDNVESVLQGGEMKEHEIKYAVNQETERILKIIDRFSYEQKESGYEFKDIVISVSILKKAIKQLNGGKNNGIKS